MLAPTRDLVAELNDRARRDRLDTDPGPVGRQVTLADQSQASAGDAIITRQNNRKIPIGAHDWVKNGDRWVVENVRESGALDVIHHDTGRHITLPAAYVAEHVSLGYASTVHGAQGITADTCYTVATGDESRQLLYVAMTRGRHANHVHLTTAGDGDEHAVITRDALLPPTAVDILTRVLARDGAPVSAASQARSLADPATRLAAGADRYYDALNTAAVDYLKREHGDAAMSRIDSDAEAALPGLTRHDAYPTLRAHLALCAVDGHAPADVLRQALSSDRGLADARDVAAVLDWRLDPTGRRSTATGRNASPLSWLPAVPDALAADAEWGTYLRDRADQVTAAAADVAARARNWTPTSAPGWALTIIDRDPALAADLAVWRAANDVPDTDRRPTGPPLPAAADARAQRALDQRVTRLLGDPRAATARWKPLADSIDERITADPYWPTLADRLTIAERAGIDITSLTHAVGGESPLPDEQPAAALWWRLSRHLSPAATTATDHSVSDTLRPDWTPVLADIVGADAADRVLADPAWPALVAAVTHARRDGWDADQLLTTAHDLLLGGQPEDEPLRPDELATALVWRIGMLTDTAATHDGYVPPDPVDEPPMDLDDLRALPDADAHFDDDWLGQPDRTRARRARARASEPRGPGPGPRRRRLSVMSPTLEEDPIAAIHAALDARDEARDFARAAEEHFWATAAVPRDRLVELNSLAEDFFTDHYRDAWAPTYLSERLGTDLDGDARFSVGYAPARWTALTDHLRRHGATDEEIVGAGLGRVASTGRVIDQFRDRLVFPIKDTNTAGDPEIHGWIGRRNPSQTVTTANRTRPDRSTSTPPRPTCSARATSCTASPRRHPRWPTAPPWCSSKGPWTRSPSPSPATVTSSASPRSAPRSPTPKPTSSGHTSGRANPTRSWPPTPTPPASKAAYRAFWQLAARTADPQHLVVADGKDPAEMLQTAGPDSTARRPVLPHRPRRRGHRRPAQRVHRQTRHRRRTRVRHPPRRRGHRRAPRRLDRAHRPTRRPDRDLETDRDVGGHRRRRSMDR